ncbi:type I restriction endonuclease [Deltaproteobacteria bacterium TL4]
MTALYESDIEQYLVELLESQGYSYFSPEDQETERPSLSEVILKNRLREAVQTLNPSIPSDAQEQAIRQFLNLPSQNLMDNNEAVHLMLTEGIRIEYMKNGEVKYDEVKLIDFENPDNNEFLVCNQFTVIENNVNKRPDVVLLINGIPLVVIELKNPADENATVHKAYTQLQNYKKAIPSLFYYNGILVASDGLDAKTGTVSSDWSRFLAWKSVDGVKEDGTTIPQLETLTKGMLKKEVLLDLIRQFIVFEKSKSVGATPCDCPNQIGLTTVTTIKKIAAYHQYFAVNKAVESTLRATDISAICVQENPAVYGQPSVESQPRGDRKAGVIWHTQGSGKSLSMVFYSGKVVITLNNPTIVVITDRNDLDDQLFDTSANCKQLLRQDPVQAENRDHLKKLLSVAGGGIVFTTIQNFELCRWFEN